MKGLSNEISVRDVILKHGIKTILCCFSGGKDSLLATHYTWAQIKELPIDFKVVHVNTTISLPGVQDYVKEVCKKFGWSLVILKPKTDFFTMAKRRGMPTRRGRWCCYKLKVGPLIEYTKKVTPPRVQITGMRANESVRRLVKVRKGEMQQLMWRDVGEHYLYSPIFWWSDEDVESYIKKNLLPLNPIYQLIGSSGECICGLYLRKEHIPLIRDHFPEFFNKFVELEKHFWAGGSAFYDYKKRERIYASNLALEADCQRGLWESLKKRLRIRRLRT